MKAAAIARQRKRSRRTRHVTVSPGHNQNRIVGVGGALASAAGVLLAAGLLGEVARPASADTAAPAIVCWTDEQGQRNCGDHVPPQYAKSAHDIYNKRGVEVQSVPREETAAEQAA